MVPLLKLEVNERFLRTYRRHRAGAISHTEMIWASDLAEMEVHLGCKHSEDTWESSSLGTIRRTNKSQLQLNKERTLTSEVEEKEEHARLITIQVGVPVASGEMFRTTWPPSRLVFKSWVCGVKENRCKLHLYISHTHHHHNHNHLAWFGLSIANFCLPGSGYHSLVVWKPLSLLQEHAGNTWMRSSKYVPS